MKRVAFRLSAFIFFIVAIYSASFANSYDRYHILAYIHVQVPKTLANPKGELTFAAMGNGTIEVMDGKMPQIWGPTHVVGNGKFTDVNTSVTSAGASVMRFMDRSAKPQLVSCQGYWTISKTFLYLPANATQSVPAYLKVQGAPCGGGSGFASFQIVNANDNETIYADSTDMYGNLFQPIFYGGVTHTHYQW